MTKIIVTVGPSSIDPAVLRQLKQAGASSFRINLSHSNPRDLRTYFKAITAAGLTPSIDTQGAQLRVASFTKSTYQSGDQVRLSFPSADGNHLSPELQSCPLISFNHPEASDQLSPGDLLKIDFSGLAVEVKTRLDVANWDATVVSGGDVIINRAVDRSDIPLQLPALTSFDIHAIDFALENQCQEVYGSFVSSADDANYIRSYLSSSTRLISKVETSRSLANIDDIIHSSDAILIDRGDLSREISISAIPMAVSSVVKRSVTLGIPVYIATNILDSMMTANIPSRAEISDIYTLLNAGASGLVLAAEVAIGKNPVASTALVEYLSRLYSAHKHGLHGIASVPYPSSELIGAQLMNWL